MDLEHRTLAKLNQPTRWPAMCSGLSGPRYAVSANTEYRFGFKAPIGASHDQRRSVNTRRAAPAHAQFAETE
jgi:hypothetical protein